MKFEELIYRITGNIVSDDLEINTEVGTTYNFVESFPHYPVDFKVAKNATKITYNDAIVKIVKMVSSNNALSSVVAEDISEVFIFLMNNVPFKVQPDKIVNREVKVRLAARIDDPIKTDLVYNVLFYMITGRTLYVRTFREFRRSILSEVELNELAKFIIRNKKSLAEYYRRNRSLLLFIKNNYFDNNNEMRSIINKISKLSRDLNKPTSNKTFKDVPLVDKPTNELLKMLHASNVITVRNGLTYKVEGRNPEPYPHEEILSILRTRDDIFSEEQLNLVNDGWTLALPSSKKKAAGIVPNGSSIELKTGDSIGIRWSDNKTADPYVDLDLSFITQHSKFGWDGDKDGIVTYSGDMTSMVYVGEDTQAASELFTINNTEITGYLEVSAYNFGSNSTKLELLIGDIILPIEKPTSTTVLGFFSNGRFYVNVDNQLNAEKSSVYDSTVTDINSFKNLSLTKYYTL